MLLDRHIVRTYINNDKRLNVYLRWAMCERLNVYSRRVMREWLDIYSRQAMRERLDACSHQAMRERRKVPWHPSWVASVHNTSIVNILDIFAVEYYKYTCLISPMCEIILRYSLWIAEIHNISLFSHDCRSDD